MATGPWSGADALEVEQARHWILDHVDPLEPEPVELGDALGLVLAEAATALEPSPAFDTSAMDGFGIGLGSAGQQTFEVIGRAMAGRDHVGDLQPGQAVRIMTGARVPVGVDVVVPLEEATEAAGVVSLLAGASRRRSNIRRSGDDFGAGEVIVPAGAVLTPAHLAVLAATGCNRPVVSRRPVVAVFSTGDEVADDQLAPPHLRDANRPGIIALVRACGATPWDGGVVPDDPELLARRLVDAAGPCDLIITTGGVSVGDRDLVKSITRSLAADSGGTSRWMKLAVRPAKPFMFATIGGTPVLGLPGNPASALVSFVLFAQPVIDRLAGRSRPLTRRNFAATAMVDFDRAPDGRTHVVPVVTTLDAQGRLGVEPASRSGRHHLAAVAHADAYALIPDGPTVPAGSRVTCTQIGDTLGSPQEAPA